MSTDSAANLSFTIVTACLNARRTIGACLESVACQTHPAVQHIVVDGLSDDGTAEIIAQHWSHSLDVIHEHDIGIADAMNKGIRAAHNDYLLFLNADDVLLCADTLTNVAARIEKCPNYDIYAFDVLKGIGSEAKPNLVRGFTPWMRFKTGVPHQGAFIDRTLFVKLYRNVRIKYESKSKSDNIELIIQYL